VWFDLPCGYPRGSVCSKVVDVCVPCTNAIPSGASFSGPGELSTSDECPWVCKGGHTLVGGACPLEESNAGRIIGAVVGIISAVTRPLH